ncbi:hypothetical protein [Gimesia fumaroli]|uniref:HEAT repeat protein n=1 Tax=Gimesia fumaroli TaxID=2527976 RepID=A0A518IG01_9PLAN|nr:hypothetical protein [Gimesia fumaroli]QDV52010.1 hypothetical protein Enr17x_40690 [Gimesia fumaroli]
MMRSRFFLCLMFLFSSLTTLQAYDVEQDIAQIKQVQKEGQGNLAASKAVKQLSQSDASALIPILNSFEGANPLAVNWLRGAFETIASNAIKQNKLPVDQLEKFILDKSKNPRARRLAYETLIKVDSKAEDRLIPGMINDPSVTLRRDAVQRLIDEAKSLEKAGKKDQAKKVYQQALSGATDGDQVKAIVKPLRTLGQKIDLQKHFGFLSNWMIVGPFDNSDKKGYDTAYAPEEKIDFTSALKGKEGEVEWKSVNTEDDYGIFDIAKSISPYKGAVMYCTADFYSPEEQELEIRLGTPNAWKIWVNGKLLFARNEYHRGMVLDQYSVPVTFKPGKNVILLKLCQNEQTESWAQRYQFQLRIARPSGTGVLSQKPESTTQLSP